MKTMTKGETARTVMVVIPVYRLSGTTNEQRAALVATCTDRAQIKKWGLILHDRDVEDPHWQLVVQTAKDLPADRFAAWFAGAEPVRKLAGGLDALLDGMLYLTHRDQPDKAQYAPDEISSTPGWDWEADLRTREIRAGGKGGGRGRARMMRALLDGHLTVAEARRRGVGNERAARTARHRYLAGLGSHELPAVRVNFYLQLPSTQHPQGVRLAEALARTLSVDQRYYAITRTAPSVDDYDGEGVVIAPADLELWGQHYFASFGEKPPGPLGTVHDLLATLGPTPTPHELSTRYGPTQLIHQNTVLVGTHPFPDFLADLERGYAAVMAEGASEQAHLSLPVVVPVSADEFAIQINTRFALGRGELDQYAEVDRVRLGLVQALQRARRIPTDQREDVVRELETKQTRALLEAGDTVARGLGRDEAMTAHELLEEFGDLGEPLTRTAITAATT